MRVEGCARAVRRRYLSPAALLPRPSSLGPRPLRRPALPLLLLILLLQLRDYVRVGQRGRIAQRATLSDVAEQTPHDLARARLGEVGREENVVRAGERSNFLRH